MSRPRWLPQDCCHPRHRCNDTNSGENVVGDSLFFPLRLHVPHRRSEEENKKRSRPRWFPRGCCHPKHRSNDSNSKENAVVDSLGFFSPPPRAARHRGNDSNSGKNAVADSLFFLSAPTVRTDATRRKQKRRRPRWFPHDCCHPRRRSNDSNSGENAVGDSLFFLPASTCRRDAARRKKKSPPTVSTTPVVQGTVPMTAIPRKTAWAILSFFFSPPPRAAETQRE